jgi:ornithine cyclodeaminase/alanine dehydrogenase-like protein (mu-crystallin family)
MDGSNLNVDAGTLLLTGDEIAGLVGPADYRAAVEAAFRASAEGLGDAPAPMHIEGRGGGFHVKGAGFPAGALGATGRAYVAFKVNGNFPGNPERCGRPTIQGVIVLCDGEDGRVLALMDSIEITLQRTAAASAVAAERLARPASRTIAICGCGAQASPQLRALADVLPLEAGFAWDRDAARAERLAARADELGIKLVATSDLATAVRGADVVVTCTTAEVPYLKREHVAAGTFIAAVGADAPRKNELAPDLFPESKVVADVRAQALTMGDTRHAVAARAIRSDGIHAELGEIVAGRRPGRSTFDEITIFDSTGVAIQDVASAARVYELAGERGVGRALVLAPAEDRG